MLFRSDVEILNPEERFRIQKYPDTCELGGGGSTEPFVPTSFFHGGKIEVRNCSVIYCSTIA